jgi:hypothetical protein
MADGVVPTLELIDNSIADYGTTSRRALWLLNRSRRKAQRRQARARYLHVRALDGWAGVAGVELQPWQRTLLAQAMRRERSHD